MRIRVIDLETTGLAPPETVVEIGWCDVLGLGQDWTVDPPRSRMVDPLKAIPPEASAIHHITDDDVREANAQPLWPLFDFLEPEADLLAAHNAKFERQWITDQEAQGRRWICTYKAALRLWPDAPAHSNQVLRYWRRPPGLDRTIAAGAHRAAPDAYVTAFLLRDMLAAGTSIDDLVRWTSEPALQIRCQIGKNRGLLWTEVDEGFLRWLLDKDFDEDVKFTARSEIARRKQAAVHA